MFVRVLFMLWLLPQLPFGRYLVVMGAKSRQRIRINTKGVGLTDTLFLCAAEGVRAGAPLSLLYVLPEVFPLTVWVCGSGWRVGIRTGCDEGCLAHLASNRTSCASGRRGQCGLPHRCPNVAAAFVGGASGLYGRFYGGF